MRGHAVPQAPARPYLLGPGFAGKPDKPMHPDLTALEAQAAHRVGDIVHWRGTVYRVIARYWRRSTGRIVYDLLESVRPGATPRRQYKVAEAECHKPSLHTLGLAPRNPYD